jgi:hypothetical protein
MKNCRTSLLMILSAVLAACASATSSIEKQGPVYRIVVPSTGQVLEFPSEGFKVEMADNSRPYYYVTNAKIGLNLSFNFEPARNCTTSESCRDYFANKLKSSYPNKKDWQTSRIGDVFVSENMDGPVDGFNLRQQHMNAHFVKDGVWIDVHMSKVNYRQTDRELFVNQVRAIRFRPKS